MLTLAKLKAKACALCGDTSGTESILYRDHLTDFANYTIRDVEQEVRLKCKHKDFFYREFEIATDTLGTDGDYALPTNFGAVLPKFGVRSVNINDLGGWVEGISLQDFQKVVTDGVGSRSVFTIHGKSPQRYIRFHPTPLASGLTITVTYDAKEPLLVSDNDPITVFPENDGWEPILYTRMAAYAFRHHQGTFKGDPYMDYRAMLDAKIISMNSDAPDRGGQPVHLDDVARAEIDIARGRWTPTVMR